MQINSSEYSKKLYAYETTLFSLNRLAKNNHLPEDIKKEINKLHKKIKSYDIEQHKERELKLQGEFLTEQEIKEIVVNATGYTCWNVYKDEDCDHNWLLEHFGIDVDVKDIVTYLIDRSTNSRNDIFLIKVTVLPGYTYLTFDTGRVGYHIEHLVANNELANNIAAQFE